jgi:hypothetical protein
LLNILKILLLLFISKNIYAWNENVEPVIKVETEYVIGYKNVDWRSYLVLSKAMDAYDKYKYYAPAAPLKFRIHRWQEHASFDELKLRIENSGYSINIPVAADGTFSLSRNEELIKNEAELVLNKKKGEYRWVPFIKSPGLPANTIRLGDMRLACEMLIELERSEVSLLLSSVFSNVKVCTSKNYQFYWYVENDIRAVIATYDGRREQFKLTKFEGRPSFKSPVNDKEWPDDTLFELYTSLPINN